MPAAVGARLVLAGAVERPSGREGRAVGSGIAPDDGAWQEKLFGIFFFRDGKEAGARGHILHAPFALSGDPAEPAAVWAFPHFHIRPGLRVR